jgi:hypothetical protein
MSVEDDLITIVEVHCEQGCSERFLMAHAVYQRDEENGSITIRWEKGTIDYLRAHIAEHHA